MLKIFIIIWEVFWFAVSAVRNCFCRICISRLETFRNAKIAKLSISPSPVKPTHANDNQVLIIHGDKSWKKLEGFLLPFTCFIIFYLLVFFMPEKIFNVFSLFSFIQYPADPVYHWLQRPEVSRSLLKTVHLLLCIIHEVAHKHNKLLVLRHLLGTLYVYLYMYLYLLTKLADLQSTTHRL